jgi:hypothetical protein
MTTVAPNQDVSRSRIYIFGSMGLPLAMISYPLSIWLPRLYASDVGLSLALIGTVISMAAIVDAFTDPLMGFISDRVRTPWGRRKPWILLGTPIFGLSVWMLLNPSPGSTVVYLALWFIMLRIGSTLFGLPYTAWSAELSANYHTRTIIQSARRESGSLIHSRKIRMDGLHQPGGSGRVQQGFFVCRQQFGYSGRPARHRSVVLQLWHSDFNARMRPVDFNPGA